MEDFIVQLIARLDTSKTPDDLKKIEKLLNEKGVQLKPVLDTTTAKKEIHNLAKQMQEIMGDKKNFENFSVKDWETSINRILKDTTTAVTKIKELQSSGSLNLNMSKTSFNYENLQKLGVVTDDLKSDFSQLKVLYDSIGTSTSDEQLLSNFKAFDSQLAKVNNSIQTVKISTKSISGQLSELDVRTFKNQLEAWKRVNSNATQFHGRVDQIISQLSTIDDKSGLTELRRQFREVNSEADMLGVKGKNLRDTLSGSARKFTEWLVPSTVVMGTVNGIKDMIKGVKSLDDALVDLRKTSDATNEELREFYYSSPDIARDLGVNTKAIIEATSAWSRLGYAIDEATTMGKNSAIFASISPGMSIDEATDGLTSAIKAFKIEADDALDGVISKINIIGNTQAVENQDIVDILTRSASAMAEGNNTLEQVIALGTAATEITRDAASVGTALKTVSLRLRGYDEELESYTLDVENLTGTIADLTKTAKSAGGISLFTDASKTEYKSTYDILKDIREVYGDLTDKNQAELLEALGGKRQANVLAAILNNFDAAEKSMDSMANSAGNAMEEMEVIYDSLDYKLNRLSETGTAIAQNLFEREGMKAVVDGVTGIAQAVEFLTDKLGLLGTITTVGAGILSVKNIGKTNYSCLH